MTISDGSIGGITNTKGTVNINGGSIKSVTNGTNKIKQGNVIITDGTVSSSVGIENYGDLKISGGTINGADSYHVKAIRNYGNVNITGGTINAIAKWSSNYWDHDAYGIYNDGGTITLGVKDGDVTENINILATSPQLTDATSYACGIINYSGTLNMYDGVIKAKDDSIYGVVDEIEDNNELVVNTVDDLLVASLIEPTGVAYIGENTDNMYSNLQDAINACSNDDTIKLVRNTTIVGNTRKIVSDDKRITIDLNGNNMMVFSKEAAIQNSGDLEITNTLEKKKIYIYGWKFISNIDNGKLKLNKLNINELNRLLF